MPDQPTSQPSQFERWLDLDQPAPDLRAEIDAGVAQAQAELAANAAKFEHLSRDEAEALMREGADKMAELLAGAPAPADAQTESQVYQSAMADTVADFREGRIDAEQFANSFREAFAPFEAMEGVVQGDIDALQDRIDDARDDLAGLRDASEARGTAPASPEEAVEVLDFMQSGLEVVEAQIDLRADIGETMHQSLEAMLDARAEMPGADPARIEAQRAAMERTHDEAVLTIDALRDDYDVVHEKLDVLGDHILDGDIPIGSTEDEVEAVVADEYRAIEQAHEQPADAGDGE